VNIGELSARTRVSPRSIRYYEEQGLLSPARSPAGYRQYGQEAEAVVRTIRSMYEIGFSTDDVREVLPCATGGHELVDAAAIRATVESMRDGIADRIDELTRTRDRLTEFLDSSAISR
jgi:DNA-binding transcriptional MerR regulator